MDLRQLRYFVVVVDQGSINAAAQVLHVAQSAVSRQIQNLEAEIGGPLFDRVVGGATVNALGQQLVVRARFILHEVESTQRDISRLSQDVRGTVRIAAPSSIGQLLYVPVIDAMARHYPRVQLEMTESSTAEVVARLTAGQLDFGIITESEPLPHLGYQKIFREPVMLVSGKSREPAAIDEAKRQQKSISKISRRPTRGTVVIDEGMQASLVISSGLRRIFSARFGPITPAVQLDSIDAAIKLVLSGRHRAALPLSAITGHHARHDFVAQPIADFEVDRLIVSVKGRPESLAAQALRRTVLEQARNLHLQ